MTRTIKFRAKRIDNGEWVYGHYYENMLASFIVVDKIDYYVVDKSTLWQFTGLKDKKGVEIFEGDIIEWKYLNAWQRNEVKWVEGGFVSIMTAFKDDLNEMQNLSLISKLEVEIIGNVTDNKELLS